MEPAISKGSLILTRPGTDYVQGDIVAFHRDHAGLLVTHRIVGITYSSDNTQLLYTKGDANEVQDMDPISVKAVSGKVVWSVPFIGNIVYFTKSVPGFLLLIVLPALGLIVSEILNIRGEKNKKNELVLILLIFGTLALLPLSIASWNDTAELQLNSITTGNWPVNSVPIFYTHQTVDITNLATDNE